MNRGMAVKYLLIFENLNKSKNEINSNIIEIVKLSKYIYFDIIL
jgi:hypothetical protein